MRTAGRRRLALAFVCLALLVAGTPVAGQVDVGLEDGDEVPISRLSARAHEPLEASFAIEDGALTLPLLVPAVSAAGVEIAVLERSLERSVAARAELAAQLEASAAENEQLEELALACEERRRTLEAWLAKTTRRLADVSTERDELRADGNAALEREAELRRRTAELAASAGLFAAGDAQGAAAVAGDGSGDLERRLEAAEGQRDRLAAELAAVKAEVQSQRDGRLGQQLELARLRRQLEAARSETKASPPGAGKKAASKNGAAVEPTDEPPALAASTIWTSQASRLRAGPDTGEEILARLPEGTTLTLLRKDGAWRRVALRREGWVLGSYLEADGDGARTAERLNLRAGPGPEATVIDSLPAGADVVVLDRGGDWRRVRVDQEGWVYGRALTAGHP